ncbi:MAG: hypothetical protein LUD74_00415 [Tannerellaceae bacterium]|nr:hypothetical protein [Tannerellaceae bacterium]
MATIYLSFTSTPPDAMITIHTDRLINDSYIGNGAQWDPYQGDYGNGPVEISPADWQKLYDRLDFMRPQFMRVMINTTSQWKEGKPLPAHNTTSIDNILGYCQSRGVTVMFGDWGGGMVSARAGEVNKTPIRYAAEYLNYLVNTKGYTCIRYYNMINEPNGDWSATNTSYPLWAEAIRSMYQEMKQLKLTGKVGLVGPDAAIWDTTETWWVDSCALGLNDQIALYDIHTYPSKITVNSNEFTPIIDAYRQKVPEGKKIVMGEIGFKFVEPADPLYLQENIRRTQATPYASTDDSQMFVYDYMYGTDMADALFQTVNSGYSGSVVWMLDDAMHSKESPEKLKVWGFWNILGEEYFGAEQEKVRPWYYAWSLLTRYMPAGANVWETTVSGNPAIKAIAVEQAGKYMLAVVNVSGESKEIRLTSTTLPQLEDCRKYMYAEGMLRTEGDHILLPNETGVNLHLHRGETFTLPAESLLVLTTFDY